MLSAAVYDNDGRDLEELCGIIQEYGERAGGVEINKFEEPERLSSAVHSGKDFSFFVLGVDESGDGLVRELRELIPESYIIVLPATREFGTREDGRTVVLPKPLVKDELKSAVNTAVNLTSEGESRLAIFTPRGEKNVALGDIMYVEVLGHTLRFYLADGQRVDSKVLRITFEKSARPLFCDSRFLRPHRSYLVNCDYIERIKRAELHLKNGADIPVSRLRLQDIRRELAEVRAECP